MVSPCKDSSIDLSRSSDMDAPTNATDFSGMATDPDPPVSESDVFILLAIFFASSIVSLSSGTPKSIAFLYSGGKASRNRKKYSCCLLPFGSYLSTDRMMLVART